MKKHGLFLSALLLAYAFVQAQDQFVEVVVNDTLLVEPTEWYYFMKLEEGHSETDATDLVEPAPTTTKTKVTPKPKALPSKPITPTRDEKLEQLKALVKMHSGELLANASLMDYRMGFNKYLLGNYSQFELDEPYAMHIRFTSRESVQKFIVAIGNRTDVEGGVLRINHPKLATMYDVLDVKLVEASRLKAARLAQLAGRKLGPITQVIEPSDATRNPTEQLFEKLMTLLGSKSQLSKMESEALMVDQIKIEKTLKFRFAFQ